MVRDSIQGRTLGDFVVRDKLGEGGFGAVYRAEQPLLQREAVVKVLHHHLRASDIVIQRFLREARLASHLDHPYAAHVYAFGAEPDGLLWIAMELVRGTPLDALLREQGTLPIERLVPLVDRICEVVHTAHEQGIVHRDIKPANVIVLSRAGRLLPKLLDFGIAKAITAATDGPLAQRASAPELRVAAAAASSSEPDVDGLDPTVHDASVPGVATLATHVTAGSSTLGSTPGVTLTRAGAIVGSPSYMAPEQWVDPSAADARTDLYALGVLAYESLTGRRPFEGKTLTEVAMAHASGVVPPVGGDFPAALDGVFAKAFANQPDDRFANALEFAVAFRAACGLAIDSRASLPQLDESLRDALLADAPQPIAEAVAALAAASSARQARDTVRVLVRAATRMLALAALACRTRLGPSGGRDAEPVVQALQALRRRPFSDEAWLDLALEICRPYGKTPDVFPVPELVGLFFDPQSGAARSSPLDDALAAPDAAGVSDDQVRELLARLLPTLARFLRSIVFLADYPLVVWRNGRAELWMGVRRPKRAAIAVQGKPLPADRPSLVDREGRPVLSLWPLVQIGAPSPGAPDELFLFDGKGRHGARLVALPQELERHDDTLWSWFGDTLLDTLDTSDAPLLQNDAPYRGLAAFGPADATLFFGRERELDAFLNRLRTQPLLAVVGPSGAGKSSFVQAGVVPALPAGWSVITMRPGPSPVATLQARLASLAATSSSGTTVLVVDQFEELFTLCLDAEQRVRFADMLSNAARSVEDPVRIVITLRDDFLIHAEQLEPLRTRLAQGLQLLATPARSDLLRILVEPARKAGFDFEDRELPERMVDEVIGQPGALALLSFSAAKLWALRDRHFKQLGRKAYEAMGGVGGALAQHAEEMLATLSTDEQRLVREAFRNLVTSEGTRAVLSRRDLAAVLGGGDRANTVIERLVGARLLVASEGEAGEERIEIIHEALLAAWPRLVQWRREDAEGARLRDQLRAAARQWEEHKRTRGLLWRDEALAEYELWRARHPGALTESETAFANASLAEARRGRRVRRGLLALAFVSLVGVAIALTIFNRQAREQTAEARRQIIKLYTEHGRRALLDGYRQRALVYLAEAWRLGGRDPALHYLVQRAGTALEQQIAKLEGHSAWVRDARFSPDGKTIATIADDHTARLWDASTGQQRHLLGGHTDWVRGLVFSPDGGILLTASWDGSARAWNPHDGTLLWSVDLHGGQQPHSNPHDELMLRTLPCAADVSSDGSRFVAACVDTRAAIISRDGNVERWLEDHASFVRTATFSPDGRWILSVPVDHAPRVFDASTGAKRFELLGHEGRVVGASFSPDRARILTWGRDGSARLWSSEDGRSLAVLRGHQGPIWTARMSRDGTRITTSGVDRTLRIWDSDGSQLRTVSIHDAPVSALAVAPSGTFMFSGDESGIGILSDRDGHRLAVFEGHKQQLWTADFSNDGSRVVTASGDGTASIWRIAGDHRETVAASRHVITGLRWKPATAELFTSSEDGTIRRWFMDGSKRSELVKQFGNPLWSLQISWDGVLLATSTNDGIVHLLETRSGRVLHQLRGHRARVNGMSFDRQRELIATGSEDGTVMIWDLNTGARVRELAIGSQPIYAVAFDEATQALVVGGADGTLRVYNASWSLARSEKYDAEIGHVAVCDSKLVVGAGSSIHVNERDGNARGVINTSSGDPLFALRCPQQQIVSASSGEVRISDLSSTLVLGRVRVMDVNLFAVDVDVRGRIAVGGAGGTVSLIELSINEQEPDVLVHKAQTTIPLEIGEEGTLRERR